MRSKKLPKRKLPHLSDKGLKKIVPMFVESKNSTADHKCGNCVFRIKLDNQPRCALVKGYIDFKNGTCAFWVKGSPAEALRPVRMDKDIAGYVEVTKKNGKVNCKSCEYYNKGICTLWEGTVHDGDCCMAWKEKP